MLPGLCSECCSSGMLLSRSGSIDQVVHVLPSASLRMLRGLARALPLYNMHVIVFMTSTMSIHVRRSNVWYTGRRLYDSTMAW